MKFVINEVEWEIKEKTDKEVTDCYNEGREEKATKVFGLTIYSQNEIWIDKDLKDAQKRRTLIHELVHCWLWSYGFYYIENYSEELICDIISAMMVFLDRVLKQYEKEGGSDGMRRQEKRKRET